MDHEPLQFQDKNTSSWHLPAELSKAVAWVVRWSMARSRTGWVWKSLKSVAICVKWLSWRWRRCTVHYDIAYACVSCTRVVCTLYITILTPFFLVLSTQHSTSADYTLHSTLLQYWYYCANLAVFFKRPFEPLLNLLKP
jgi:hypothetical protein